MVRIALLFACLLFAEGALAQTPSVTTGSPVGAPKAAPPKPAAAKPAAPPPAPKKKASARRKPKADKPAPLSPILGAVVTSPSFRMLDEGKSRVFLEVSQKVGVTEQKARGRVVYKLKGTLVPAKNSLRPLPTGFFPTPVGQIELAKQDDGAALIIELREPAEPSHRVIETPRGITLQVDFPAISRSSSKRE